MSKTLQTADPGKLVSIISVGTELTTGELINGNAAWLSEKLSDLGFTVAMHLTVPDDRPLIQSALREGTRHAQFVFITGGLGPTSDDFTREEIATFAKLPLVWNETAWKATTARLNSVGAPVVDSNKQQCFFPEGSEIFLNSEGTAAGFSLKTIQTEIIVLPGPPNEIAAIWCDHLRARLESKIPLSERMILKRMICLGLSESKLGELVEDVLKPTTFAIGYRTRMPFVDVKVWVTPKEEQEFETHWRPKLEAVVGKFLFGKDNDDAAELCHATLPKDRSVLIVDAATSGRLAARLLPVVGPDTQLEVMSIPPKSIFHHKITASEVIEIYSDIETGYFKLIRKSADGLDPQTKEHTTRYKGSKHRLRFEAYICEFALATLTSWWQPNKTD